MKPVIEFKFACPVCHQHIMADSDMGGTQIECPTCFRQIIVPRAPSGNTTKLILRGTQARKPQTRFSAVSGRKPDQAETSLATLAAVVVLIVTTLAFAVSFYAKNNDRVQKINSKPHVAQTSYITK